MQIYNPFRIIRELRARVAYLEGRLDEVSERAEEAEARAFDRAARRWQFEIERTRSENAALLQNAAAISNMSPFFQTMMTKMEGSTDAG